MKRSKLLTLLVMMLAVCTLVGVMAFSAFAAEADHPHAETSTHCVCGGAGEMESHTSCTEEVWTAWTNGMTSPTSGRYYLAEDVTISAAISLKGSLRLCLNGYTLTVSGGNRAFTYVGTSYLELEICDCSEAQSGKITVSNTKNQGGVAYFGRGKMSLYSGTLENTAETTTTNGGILRLGQAGNTADKSVFFYMYGGTLQGGIAKNGGSIYADNSSNITVTLLGGTITGGQATDGEGGNIYIAANGGTLKLKGTTVTGGTATGNGGNICCLSAMEMSGGWVYGGKSDASMGGNNIRIQNSAASLKMTGGYVGEIDQTVTTDGHNLSILNAPFTMTGGTIKGMVRANATTAASVNLSGDARIVGGNKGILVSSSLVTLTVGELTDKASVGVTLGGSYEGTTFATATADPAGKIYSSSKYSNVEYLDGTLVMAPKTMQVGFAKTDINPAVGTPLGGYSNSEARLSTGNDENYGLYATCVAITDEHGETVLLITADLVNAPEAVVSDIRAAIKEATGVPADHIMVAATHTHTAPDLTLSNNDMITAYKQELCVKLAAAAQTAIADQAASSASIGTVDIAGQTYIRHYTDENGAYYGYEFTAKQAVKDGKTLTHVAEPDCTMQLLKFDRGGDKTPVVLANWQTHPHLAGVVDYASADLVGAFRDALSQSQGWNVAYFSGASGNVNPDSVVAEYDKTYVTMGQAMAEAAAAVTFTETGLNRIAIQQNMYKAALRQVTEEEYNAAVAFLETVTAESTNQDAIAAGFNSLNHARAIKTIYTLNQKGETATLELNAISLGQVAFATAPYEMFSDNGVTIKSNNSHKMTFVLTQANGRNGYIPSELPEASVTNTNGGVYELDNTRFVTGTGEELAQTYVSMLAELVTDKYCVCGNTIISKPGHTCEAVAWQAFPENGMVPTAGNYYLAGDITISFDTTQLCKLEGHLAIDLRGHTLSFASTAGGRVFSVSAGATLSICDTVGGGKLEMTGSTTQAGGMIFNYSAGVTNIYGGTVDASGLESTKEGVAIRNAAGSSVTLYGGTVIGGTATGNGGAISNAGTLTLAGGNIQGGSAKNGGAVYNSGSGATLELLYSSAITGGTATDGGAVYNSSSAALKLTGANTQITGGTATGNGGNVYMTSGTARVYGKISGGTADLGGNLYTAGGNTWLYSRVGEGTATKGGNVYHGKGGLFLFGSEIRNAVSGGGIYAQANLTVGGAVKTVANKMDEDNTVNVYLTNGALITAGTESAPLVEGASIGITLDSMQTPFGTQTTYYAEGIEAKDVFFAQDSNCGIVEEEGKLYFQQYAARAYYADKTVASGYASKGYYTIEDAIAHEGMIYVGLRSDYEGDLTISKDLYLDLAGYSINGTLTVAEGCTLYGMDSNTDGYSIENGYGKVKAIVGDYEMTHGEKLTTNFKRYVAIEEETGISFHRYYAAITHINLNPGNDALGFKAQFYGDEMVQGAVEAYGYKMWVNQNNVKTCTAADPFTNGKILTLRVQNVMAANGGEVPVYGQAYIQFKDMEEPVETTAQTTTMKQTVAIINGRFGTLENVQKRAVKAFVTAFAEKMSGWDISAITAWTEETGAA